MSASAPYLKVLEAIVEHGYTEEDVLKMPAKQSGEMIYELCVHNDIQIQAFKDTRKKLYRERGFKVAGKLRQLRQELGGEIACSLVRVGEMPLKSKSTVALARKIQALIVPKSSSGRVKIERVVTRNSLVHIHFVYHATQKSDIPTSIEVDGAGYKVETVFIGDDPNYNNKYDYSEQVERMVTYMYKPSNMAGTNYHKKLDLKHAAYLLWFLDESELYKLTRDEHRKIRNGIRLSWNIRINNSKR